MLTFPVGLWTPSGPATPPDPGTLSPYAWYKSSAGLYDAVSGGSLVTADNAYIRRWEDQSGNGRHLTQSTDANRMALDATNGYVVSEGYDTGGNTNQFMNLPASFTLNRRDFSAFFICAPENMRKAHQGAGTPWLFHFLTKSSADDTNIFWRGDTSNFGKLAIYTGAFNYSTLPLHTTRPTVFGCVGSASGLKFWSEGDSSSIAALASGNTTWTQLFGYSAGHPSQAAVKEALVFNYALTDAQYTNTILAYARTIGVPSSRSKQIIFEGDSITHGYGQDLNRTWPSKLSSSIADSVRFRNTAESGYTMAGLNSDYSSLIAPLYVSGQSNIICVFAGTNDIVVNGQTDTTTYNNLTAYTSAARATGFKVIWFTMLDRNQVGTNETRRQAYNTSIRNNYATLADGLVDVDADSRLSDSANTTYFLSDQTHPNEAGAAVIAELAEPVIAGLL